MPGIIVSKRKHVDIYEDNRLNDFSVMPSPSSQVTPSQLENKIDRLQHFVDNYLQKIVPSSCATEMKDITAEASLDEKFPGNFISVLPKPSEEMSTREMPSWFSCWANKKDKEDRNFQEDMRHMMGIISRKFHPPEQKRNVPSQQQQKTACTIQDCLPLKTMLEFKLFNERLREEPGFKYSLMNYLKNINATNTKQAIVGFFAKCMDDELMCNFTWAGHTRTKSELQSTPLAKFILDVVMNIDSLNNPSLSECQKYGSEAVRYANQRRNQTRAARERGQQQLRPTLTQYEAEFVEQPDEADIGERNDPLACELDRFGIQITSSDIPGATLLPHPGHGFDNASQSAVSSYMLPTPSAAHMQSYSSGSRKRAQPLIAPPWSSQDQTSYHQRKMPHLSLTSSNTVKAPVTTSTAVRQNSSSTITISHSSTEHHHSRHPSVRTMNLPHKNS